MRKELWFGLSLMGLIVLAVVALMPWGSLTTGHLGLLMLALVVVAIMLGFPTAFTLMGMGMIFALFAYWSRDPGKAVGFTLDLMVQRTYAVMSNDVLISIPLFVFMGYLVERANLISKLFKSLQLALVRLPGSLAVATLFTCAVFATATGIVGAVVTLMGLLALPAMMRSGYDVRISAGVITAGGCLGILIPPSVMLIVYGATAGVSVVKLYAGAFFPGLMLAGLYILYVIVLAKIKPTLMPALSEEERRVDLGPLLQTLRDHFGSNALAAMVRALKGTKNIGVPMQSLIKEFLILLIPAMFCAGLLALLYLAASPSPENTQGAVASQVTGVTSQSGSTLAEPPSSTSSTGLAEPPSSASSTGLAEPPSSASSTGLAEPPSSTSSTGLAEPPSSASSTGLAEPPSSTSSTGLAEPANTTKSSTGLAEAGDGQQTGIKPQSASTHELPLWYKLTAAVMLSFLALLYWRLTMVRLEVFKMLLASFFPLAFLILSVLGTIVFGLATPTEAAAVGSLGGFLLAFAYKQLNLDVVRESVFLTAKTSAMVCWLFVGSSIFSAAFALLGGQELIESWVLSLGLSKIQFLLLSQVIIFLLGWPLEWTEIIVIFMPIFIPLLAKFGVDPLFFGLLVALNLQTAFLSPPVAMAAFYLKGVAPPEVSLNQIFAGMMPFMAIQVFALFLLYVFPEIGLWLPEYMYK
ncbi:MAG: TRAP transporter large permease subunit [Betaproteobacteria bacterium]|nr:TRAP transporter large permease subunit [Betaproteobacteria bacterium]NBU00675.1 TRAP transporter large permease subunit [Betaproteobacteria bacterium]NCY18759.1 TRAP transporter large permease subunit [Betaproteobacteria bacterium]NDA24614.1 TRAP transporter large permease subunit [Betaproteobacteria bacterium]